jgi:hypothetical protein
MKTPPHPDEAGDGGGFTWDTKRQVGRPLVNQPVRSAQAPELLRHLEAARQHFDRQTVALEIIAHWRDSLRGRLACAELRFELIGLPTHEQQALVAEVHDFKRACRCLAWPGKRPAT